MLYDSNVCTVIYLRKLGANVAHGDARQWHVVVLAPQLHHEGMLAIVLAFDDETSHEHRVG